MAMIGIHPVHRRLMEIEFKARRLGGYSQISAQDQMDLRHCLRASADMIFNLDLLKDLSYQAYVNRDSDWQHEICKQIEEVEAKMM